MTHAAFGRSVSKADKRAELPRCRSPDGIPSSSKTTAENITHEGVAYIESEREAVFYEDASGTAPLFSPGRFDPSRPDTPFGTARRLRLFRLGKRVSLPLIAEKPQASL
jgi:hypothetical protein